MSEPKWIDHKVVLAIHARQIKEHGGVHGLRDEQLLHSSLDAPKNSYHYEKSNIIVLAAKYVHSLAGNHPFADGNKRTAYICMRLFLQMNGKDIQATGEEKIRLMVDIASSALSVADIALWIEKHQKDFTR